ncbi:MAG: cell division protein ZapA [Peptostreptococcaceae bacterium]|nr:cell division protein ZapA [Peptostreptococcaceae bacterium]
MNKIVVKIANQEYSIAGDEEKDYILSLASHVDEQIKIALEKSPKVNNVTPVILASINIADQYFKQKEKNKELMEQINYSASNEQQEDWMQRDSDLIEEQNESINKLFERIQKLDNILLEKNKEISDLQAELDNRVSENQKLNELINQFQNDIYNLQIELTALTDDALKGTV